MARLIKGSDISRRLKGQMAARQFVVAKFPTESQCEGLVIISDKAALNFMPALLRALCTHH